MSRNLIALQNRFLGQGQTVYDELARVHAAQGHVSDDDITRLAAQYGLPPALVRATAAFYDDLSQQTPADHCLEVCNGEACRAAGGDALLRRCQKELGVETGQVSARGARLKTVTCLGYCGLGPNVMVDGLPVSLAGDDGADEVLMHVQDGRGHGLTEPDNPVHPPADGQPCVLLRHHGHDVTRLAEAQARGIYTAIERARAMDPEAVIETIEASRLRGRGGAGFPAGTKLRTVRASQAPDGSGRRFAVVNFDEGDAGAYIDKELVERDPHTQIEGILIAAHATGAQQAYVYARGEYPRARAVLEAAVAEARDAGLLDPCDITVVRGQGAYICGEETSLLRSLEGLPALVSVRPPFPAQQGLWRCPTAVHNVETIHNLPWIVEHGGDAYAALGHDRSRGTKLVSLNTRVARPGLYEVELGTTLRQVICELAGGMAEGHRFKAVQVGGPLGGVLPEALLDTPLDFEALAAAGGLLGHGGIVVYAEADDLVEIGRGLFHFCAVESCGKCFPCRIGAVRGTELFDRMMSEGVTDARLDLLRDLCETMKLGSLCAMGGMTPAPIESILEHFPQELDRYRHPGGRDAAG